MLTSSLAPYLLWAKTRQPAAIDLAGSNLLHCALDDLPGAREALELTAPNDNGYAPVVEAIAAHYASIDARVVVRHGMLGRELPDRRGAAQRGRRRAHRAADVRPAHRRVPVDGREHHPVRARVRRRVSAWIPDAVARAHDAADAR